MRLDESPRLNESAAINSKQSAANLSQDYWQDASSNIKAASVVRARFLFSLG